MYLPGGTWKFPCTYLGVHGNFHVPPWGHVKISKYLAALHVYKAHGNFHVPPWGHMEISKYLAALHVYKVHGNLHVYLPAWARGNYHVLSRITLPCYERVR